MHRITSPGNQTIGKEWRSKSLTIGSRSAIEGAIVPFTNAMMEYAREGVKNFPRIDHSLPLEKRMGVRRAVAWNVSLWVSHPFPLSHTYSF